MPTRPTTRHLQPLLIGAVLATAAAGCKSTGSGDGGSAKADPIFGRHIPKQDLPIPGKDGYGSDTRDPLLRNTQASRDGDRYEKEPFRTGAGTTPASLAAKGGSEASIPSIDDRPTGTPTSRNPVPFKPAAGDSGATFDQSLDELRRLGVKWNSPRRGATGETVFECDLPLGPNGEGPFRRYEGVGATEAAAASDALRQIKSEPNK
jgi:hypothetical protein